MFPKVWNDELEAIAQRWSDQCKGGHDSVRDKLDDTYVILNLYSNTKNLLPYYFRLDKMLMGEQALLIMKSL